MKTVAAKLEHEVRQRERPVERRDFELESGLAKDPPKPDPLKRSTPYLVTLVARLQSAVFSERTADAQISLAATYLLHELGRQSPLSHSELAERLSIGHATVAQTLKRLERDGLVERSIYGPDRRQVRVRLTAKGRRVRKRLETDGDRLMAEVSGLLGPKTEKIVQEALLVLAAHFDAARG